MRYLVEIIFKNGLSPTYQYYNTYLEIKQTILESENIESVEVYKLDKEITDLLNKE